jgi:hypothetical protein
MRRAFTEGGPDPPGTPSLQQVLQLLDEEVGLLKTSLGELPRPSKRTRSCTKFGSTTFKTQPLSKATQ